MAKEKNIRCIAVTNAPRGAAEVVIEQLKRDIAAADVIEDLIIGAECANPKPSPDPYLEAIRRLGVEPGSCIVFEDSGSGCRAGIAAGAAAVVGIRSNLSVSRPAAVSNVLFTCSISIQSASGSSSFESIVHHTH